MYMSSKPSSFVFKYILYNIYIYIYVWVYFVIILQYIWLHRYMFCINISMAHGIAIASIWGHWIWNLIVEILWEALFQSFFCFASSRLTRVFYLLYFHLYHIYIYTYIYLIYNIYIWYILIIEYVASWCFFREQAIWSYSPRVGSAFLFEKMYSLWVGESPQSKKAWGFFVWKTSGKIDQLGQVDLESFL